MFSPPGVEDPISAIFDLSDRVADMAPTMRRMYLYTATVVVLFLAIMVFLLFVGLAANAFFAVLALVAIIFGGIALSLLRETDRFYRAYVARHRAIRRLQDAEPSPKIPAGPTPVQRLAKHLAQSNPKVASLVATRPEALRYRVPMAAKDGGRSFDLVLSSPASAGYRYFGWGDPGFAVLARVGPDAPTVADLEAFGRDVQAIARRLDARVARAILVRTHPVPLPEDVYDYAVGHPIEIRRGRVAIEIATEEADGTYDFVPHVLGVP